MINILNVAKTIYGGWSVKSVDTLDTNGIKSAKVTEGDYGLSVCFFLTTGQMAFVPLDKDSSCNVGDEVALDKLKVVTLEKPGEDTIQRIRVVE